LQVFYLNVAKVNLDVASIYFSSVFQVFHTYVYKVFHLNVA
jgi:hypothetical protein